MGETILADSGAIVAALDKRDAHHLWAADRLAALRVPFVTCEAVLSECFFLRQHLHTGKESLCALLQRGAIRVQFDAASEMAALLVLIRKYSDVPMSFADACLVRMSERHRELHRVHDGLRLPHLSSARTADDSAHCAVANRVCFPK